MTPGTLVNGFLIKGVAFDYEDGDPSIAVQCQACGDHSIYMSSVLKRKRFSCPVCRAKADAKALRGIAIHTAALAVRRKKDAGELLSGLLAGRGSPIPQMAFSEATDIPYQTYQKWWTAFAADRPGAAKSLGLARLQTQAAFAEWLSAGGK